MCAGCHAVIQKTSQEIYRYEIDCDFAVRMRDGTSTRRPGVPQHRGPTGGELVNINDGGVQRPSIMEHLQRRLPRTI